ncbi:hypothetical protein [Hornefia butyriciproducens]|nr:hypothetical protein [Hornefia butyriciproducens]MDY5463970.1 hypothetical protein [Hornefia butyriciproducens]
MKTGALAPETKAFWTGSGAAMRRRSLKNPVIGTIQPAIEMTEY